MADSGRAQAIVTEAKNKATEIAQNGGDAAPPEVVADAATNEALSEGESEMLATSMEEGAQLDEESTEPTAEDEGPGAAFQEAEEIAANQPEPEQEEEEEGADNEGGGESNEVDGNDIPPGVDVAEIEEAGEEPTPEVPETEEADTEIAAGDGDAGGDGEAPPGDGADATGDGGPDAESTTEVSALDSVGGGGGNTVERSGGIETETGQEEVPASQQLLALSGMSPQQYMSQHYSGSPGSESLAQFRGENAEFAQAVGNLKQFSQDPAVKFGFDPFTPLDYNTVQTDNSGLDKTQQIIRTVAEWTGSAGDTMATIAVLATVAGWIFNVLMPPVGAVLSAVGAFTNLANLVLQVISAACHAINAVIDLRRAANTKDPRLRMLYVSRFAENCTNVVGRGMYALLARGNAGTAVKEAKALKPVLGRLGQGFKAGTRLGRIKGLGRLGRLRTGMAGMKRAAVGGRGSLVRASFRGGAVERVASAGWKAGRNVGARQGFRAGVGAGLRAGGTALVRQLPGQFGAFANLAGRSGLRAAGRELGRRFVQGLRGSPGALLRSAGHPLRMIRQAHRVARVKAKWHAIKGFRGAVQGVRAAPGYVKNVFSTVRRIRALPAGARRNRMWSAFRSNTLRTTVKAAYKTIGYPFATAGRIADVFFPKPPLHSKGHYGAKAEEKLSHHGAHGHDIHHGGHHGIHDAHGGDLHGAGDALAAKAEAAHNLDPSGLKGSELLTLALGNMNAFGRVVFKKLMWDDASSPYANAAHQMRQQQVGAMQNAMPSDVGGVPISADSLGAGTNTAMRHGEALSGDGEGGATQQGPTDVGVPPEQVDAAPEMLGELDEEIALMDQTEGDALAAREVFAGNLEFHTARLGNAEAFLDEARERRENIEQLRADADADDPGLADASAGLVEGTTEAGNMQSEGDRAKSEGENVQGQVDGAKAEPKPEPNVPWWKKWFLKIWRATLGKAIKWVAERIEKIKQAMMRAIMDWALKMLGADDIAADLDAYTEQVDEAQANQDETRTGLDEAEGTVSEQEEVGDEAVESANSDIEDYADLVVTAEEAAEVAAERRAFAESWKGEATDYIARFEELYGPFFDGGGAEAAQSGGEGNGPESAPETGGGTDAPDAVLDPDATHTDGNQQPQNQTEGGGAGGGEFDEILEGATTATQDGGITLVDDETWYAMVGDEMVRIENENDGNTQEQPTDENADQEALWMEILAELQAGVAELDGMLISGREHIEEHLAEWRDAINHTFRTSFNEVPIREHVMGQVDESMTTYSDALGEIRAALGQLQSEGSSAMEGAIELQTSLAMLWGAVDEFLVGVLNDIYLGYRQAVNLCIEQGDLSPEGGDEGMTPNEAGAPP